MGKTLQQYKDEHYASGLKQVDKLHGQRKETDAATLKQINAAIDKSTAVQTGQYQQRIDAAPLESRVEYDKNAIADAVSKQQIRESLANMGVTDSGLTSSMQTALAIQKQKADRTVRVNENAKIQAAQNAIDSILADAETKKADAKIQRETATADWYAGALADLENTTSQSAAEAYAADQEYDAKVYEAQLKYDNQVAEDRNQAIQNAVDADVENGMDATISRQVNEILYGGDANRKALYEQAIRNGMTEKEALVYVNAGGGTAGDAALLTYSAQLGEQFANTMTFDVGKSWKRWWSRPGYGDGEIVADSINSQISSNADYARLGKDAKEKALCIAVAKTVNASWTAASEDNDNYARIEKACDVLGIDTQFAKDYYDEIR